MANKDYIHPAQKRQEEHEKRKEKKKKKRGFLWFLLLLLLLAALLGGIGWGQGWFSGKGNDNDSSAGGTESAAERTIPEESSQADESSEARTPVAIKVSGSSYIYNDTLRTIEQLRTDLSVLDKNAVIVEITDDNAVANAMMSLHELLDELSVAYTDIPAVTVTTAADSSAAETATTTTAALV